MYTDSPVDQMKAKLADPVFHFINFNIVQQRKNRRLT